uniref:von Willebrand factor A domain containing 5B1 n=1 Tax=Electrophorus electricus TaxID=8005 RepID=A0A4W4DX04_ELEEL
MPGLINKAKRSALPLSASDITSCVRGYTLAMTASLTYENIEDHPVEGIFIYPLEEGSVVVGFEAMISSQIITVQIKDKAKIDDCYVDTTMFPLHLSPSDPLCDCTTGLVLLDEDLECVVLVVNLGLIPPLETVNVLVSTSSELSTLSNGGIRVTTPPVCTPRVQCSVKEEHHCAPGSHEQTLSTSQLCLARLLEEESINSIDYEFNFQLEIRGPYLLAGVESPSHAIRADADPSACSATSILVTLADKYTYDCPVEILIYPSELHLPHVLIEDGDMTREEYDEHLMGRSDYIRATKKDSSNEKKVDIIHKRLHKDILHNPVVMLNFCPDLQSMTSDLTKVQGEFVFLIDRSGSMSGVNISRVKDAMLVILKSLFPACMFNIVGFGTTFKPLFPTSQNYNEESLATACNHVKTIRADMGGTNILAPLDWVLRQPGQRGHPRQLFLLTDGAVSNTGKVIALVRSHAPFTRCYVFGMGQACRRLGSSLAAVSRGCAEFLADGERLQPKMIKCLRKSMAPVLSDISIEWFYPETKEVLLSPVGTTYLFPGDRLMGYSVVCDTTRYHPNPKSDKRRRYSMMRSNESSSSVFYHSQEEELGRSGCEGQAPPRDTTSPRRRAYSTNQIEDYNPQRKVYTPSDPSSALGKNPLRRAKVQELITHTNSDHGVQRHTPHTPEENHCSITSVPLTAPAGQSVCCVLQGAGFDRTQAPTAGWVPRGDQIGSSPTSEGYGHQLCEAEAPQESRELGGRATSCEERACKVVVTGLLGGKPVKWEVTFDIEPYQKGREREEKVHEDLWNETFHHLAARSIIRDFEQMAGKECEIEHGSGRRYQLYAIQTSKACNILSKYTAFVPIDLDSNEYLPTSIEYLHTGESLLCFDCQHCTYRQYAFSRQRKRPLARVATASHITTLGHLSLSCSRLSLTRTRLLTKAARGFMCRTPGRSGDSLGDGDNDSRDYIPLVSLQLSCGAFTLDAALCEAINVPMDKLKWTSPFSSHRVSLTHISHTSSRRSDSLEVHHSTSPPPRDPDLSFESEERAVQEPEGMVWATAVALAWLENNSASYFIEWELIAAKASLWLDRQVIPEGRDLAAVKAAANQLFIILRHWDENLQLNMLCYNPSSV